MIAIFTARIETFRFLYLSIGEWSRLHFTARIEQAPFHCDTSLLAFPYKEWPDWSLTARVQKVSLCPLKGGLVDPQARASNDINAPSKLARYLLGMGAD